MPDSGISNLVQHLQKSIEPVRLFCQNIVNRSPQLFPVGLFLFVSKPLVIGDTMSLGIHDDEQLMLRTDQLTQLPYRIGFGYSLERRRVGFACGKSVGAGIRHTEIHLRCLSRTEVTVGTGLLYLVESIPEHLIMRFFTVEQEVDGFSHLLILNLAIEIFVHHLCSLFGCDIGKQVGT